MKYYFSSKVQERTRFLIARWLAFFLLILLPIQKDGPLDLDLWMWKFSLVCLLLLFCPKKSNLIVRNFKYQKIISLLGANALLVGIAYLYSDIPEIGVDMTLAFYTMAGLLISLCRIFDRKMLTYGILAVGVVTVAACLLTIVQYVIVRFHLTHPILVRLIPPEFRVAFYELGMTMDSRGIRLPSFFFHNNELAHLLACSFGFFLPLSLQSQDIVSRSFYALILFLVLICSFLTQSRLLILLFGVTFVSSVLFRAYYFHRIRKFPILIFIGATLLSAAFLGSNFDHFIDRLFSPSLSLRDYNWKYSANLIADHWLFGVGLGCSSYHILINFAVIDYEPIFNAYYAKQPFNFWSSHSHNYFIATILETGIFSIYIQIIMYITILNLSIRLAIGSASQRTKTLAISCTNVLLIEFVRGFFESNEFLNALDVGSMIAFVMAVILYLDGRIRLKITSNRLADL